MVNETTPSPMCVALLRSQALSRYMVLSSGGILSLISLKSLGSWSNICSTSKNAEHIVKLKIILGRPGEKEVMAANSALTDQHERHTWSEVV
jgi:hypothetical protein